MNTVVINSKAFTFFVENNVLFVDAKQILKGVFASSPAYLNEIAKVDGAKESTGREPLFVPFQAIEDLFKQRANAVRVEGCDFNFSSFKNDLFDHLFETGQKQFLSDRRIEAEKNAADNLAKENAAKLLKLEKENAELKAANEARIANEKEKAKAGVNPVIRGLNSAWMPVMLSLVFGVVLGGFSFSILSETMGLNGWLNLALSTAWVLFPIVSAVRKFEFKFDLLGQKIEFSPLVLAMVVDMIFTAYHVGWFRLDGETGGNEVRAEMHSILKVAYIMVIPLMQKGINTMIMNIRSSYLAKGWLPMVD